MKDIRYKVTMWLATIAGILLAFCFIGITFSDPLKEHELIYCIGAFGMFLMCCSFFLMATDK